MPPRYAVVTVTPPAVEPVTVSEVKAYARIEDDDQDGLIAGWIETARVAAESYTNRSFITRTLMASLDGCRGGRVPWTPGYFQLPVDYFDSALPSTLDLPGGPILAVTGINTYDSADVATAFDPGNYRLAGDRIVLGVGVSWPGGLRAVGGIEFTYTAGYGDSPSDVPRPIRTAIAMHATMLEDTRGQCGCDLPPGVEMLLRPYRVMPR